jgi:hypothetical protein
MDDGFLHDQRRDPPAGYSRSLRERLRQLEDAPERRGFRLHPALAGALSVAALAVAFTIPAVRVAAQNALDLFRVRSFTAVEIDEDRIEQLKKLGEGMKDPEQFLFEKHEVLLEPGKPEEYPSASLAASAAGLPGLDEASGVLPEGLRFVKAVVSKPGAARFTVRTDQLRQVVETLGITDVQVPTSFDGQTITVNVPASVTQVYENGNKKLTVMEAMSPEVALPPGADLQRLGEIGLRVIGMDPAEARRVEASIDWRNTMVVPVPIRAATFRQVDVNGQRGLLVTSRGEPTAEGKRGERRAMVMWSEGERVHAVQANLSSEDVLIVAQSLR